MTKHRRAAFWVGAIVIAAGTAGAAQEQRPIRRFDVVALVTTAVFAPDGATLTLWDPVGWSSWDAASGNRKGREPVIGKSCDRTLALPRSGDGRVVSAQCNDRLLFFDAATGRSLGERRLAEKQTAAMYLASVDGSVSAIVMAGATNRVSVGGVPSGPATELQIEGEIEQLSLSASGHRLAVGIVTGVEVRESPAGTLLHTFPGRAAHALSADGRLLAVASDRGAQIFNVESGARVAGVEGRISYLRFSPDAKRLIGWTNQRVTVWDVASGAQQLVLKSDEFVEASASADGARLATVTLNRRGETTTSVVAVWRLP